MFDALEAVPHYVRDVCAALLADGLDDYEFARHSAGSSISFLSLPFVWGGVGFRSGGTGQGQDKAGQRSYKDILYTTQYITNSTISLHCHACG